MDCVRGFWRPSGTVASACVFAVVWSAGSGDFWAPLHDFDRESQRCLIEQCCEQDPEAARFALEVRRA